MTERDRYDFLGYQPRGVGGSLCAVLRDKWSSDQEDLVLDRSSMETRLRNLQQYGTTAHDLTEMILAGWPTA